MFLFICAFLGNTFYVASILSSPKMSLPPPLATEFLRESIPFVHPPYLLYISELTKKLRYLIGSGGTLLFDITIVSQSLIYRPRPRRHSTSVLPTRIEEEEAGLLTGEEPYANDSSSVPTGRTSRQK